MIGLAVVQVKLFCHKYNYGTEQILLLTVLLISSFPRANSADIKFHDVEFSPENRI